MIKMKNLLPQNKIFEQRRTSLTCSKTVLVITYLMTVIVC